MNIEFEMGDKVRLKERFRSSSFTSPFYGIGEVYGISGENIAVWFDEENHIGLENKTAYDLIEKSNPESIFEEK